jgi:hypothetical protein
MFRCFTRPCPTALIVALVALLFALADDGSKPAGKNAPKKAEPAKGPNGGLLIELGDDEYHAEMILDQKGKVLTIHVLDKEAKKPVLTEAEGVTINLMLHGKPKQFEVLAEPMPGEPKGKSSRFIARGKRSLMHAFEHDDHAARIALTINGKPYTGKVPVTAEGDPHAHDHDEKPGKSAEKPASQPAAKGTAS